MPGHSGSPGGPPGIADDGGPGHGTGEDAARLICLRLLAAGPRTRAQLGEALRRRRVPEETAGAVLDWFAELRLIDDAAFARAWVETRHRGRGLARRMLAAELRQRGVAADEVRSAVGTLAPQDELTTARRLVGERITATRGRPLPTRMRRLVGMLSRKGYPAGLAYRVVREALEQEGHGDLGPATGLPGTGEDPGEWDSWPPAEPDC